MKNIKQYENYHNRKSLTDIQNLDIYQGNGMKEIITDIKNLEDLILQTLNGSILDTSDKKSVEKNMNHFLILLGKMKKKLSGIELK